MFSQPVTRLYKVGDAYIIQYSKTLRGFFITDQTAFVTRDPSFDTPYETDWLNAINTANNAQEQFKGQMRGATEVRITTFNIMYGFCTNVCETGKLIMRNSYAGYQRYLLPPSDEPATTLVLSGIVTRMGGPVPGGGPSEPIEGALTQLIPQGLQSQTDSNGKFGFGSAPAGPTMLQVTHPLYMAQNIPVNIDPENPQVINVQMMPMGPMP